MRAIRIGEVFDEVMILFPRGFGFLAFDEKKREATIIVSNKPDSKLLSELSRIFKTDYIRVGEDKYPYRDGGDKEFVVVARCVPASVFGI
jgi:hypothetical protein